ncbi:hypothetical protein, partial [Actinoplanes sp. NPDC026670]|uniref:hypothetical protein n=1 Tax=Actinoplanes sp. NPDC026670 TaxID=3154700 RepID=UPI0033DE7BFB
VLVPTATGPPLAGYHRQLQRAVERGELSPASDVPVIAYVLFQAVVMWEPAHGSPPSDPDLSRILTAVLTPTA